MCNREELLEALHHLTDTRARLAKQPGTHAQRSGLLANADELLDELSDLEEQERCFSSSPSLV